MKKWKQIWRRRPRLALALGLFSVMMALAFGAIISSGSPTHSTLNALAAYPDGVGTGHQVLFAATHHSATSIPIATSEFAITAKHPHPLAALGVAAAPKWIGTSLAFTG